MSLHVWSFRRLLYEVLWFSGVIGSTATASAWISTYIVFIPLCVPALLILLCECSAVVYESRYNKRARGSSANKTKYVFTLDEEEDGFEEDQ